MHTQWWLRNPNWGVPAIPSSKLMGTLPVISQKSVVVLCLKSQCMWGCLVSQLVRLGISPSMQYVRGRHLSCLQLYCYVGGNKGPCYGFQKPLQHQSLGMQRTFLQCLGMSDCSMCQCSSAKTLAWCFYNNMACPEFSVCHRNALGLPMAQCSFKSQFFHVNPDRPGC